MSFTNETHVPVMLAECLQGLQIQPNGHYLDVTGGMGGHSQAILDKLSPTGHLSICDYHKETAEKLSDKFATEKNTDVTHARFSEIFETKAGPFDGILADFGISSPQLADENLGIGFLVEDSPLDMRIDQRLEHTAADLLAGADEAELADIFYHYGGERAGKKLAHAIVEDREKSIFLKTTTDLKTLCERVIGKFYRGKKIHPATKAFQALRIAVNRELDEIKAFLDKAPLHLKEGGRLLTISFHEGEDRLVKTKFRELAATKEYTLHPRKSIKPSDEEIKTNPRSRSARLRVLQKEVA
jgi:16S rRNA (cytosine1402-N4)-methyltransferase